MVFFTCNHCGESVKKPSVEKHYNTKCRGAPKSISCMDCQKDFNDNYVEHVKCISELEKYSGKDFVPRENANKGAKKQEGWVETVRAVLESTEYELSKVTRQAFEMLQKYDNVPRKKAKFLNFVTNSVRIPRKTVEEVWSILEKEQEKLKQNKQKEIEAAKVEKQPKENGKAQVEQNGHNDEDKKVSKKKKASLDEGASKSKVDDDGDENNAEAEVETTKKKKQKKKKNHDVDDTAAVTEETMEAESATNGDVSAKKKKMKHSDVEEANTNGTANDVDENVSKKKKKKTSESFEHQNGIEQNSNNTEYKKNKKSSASNDETVEVDPPKKKQKVSDDSEIQPQENGGKKNKKRPANNEDSQEQETPKKKQKQNGESKKQEKSIAKLDENEADAFSWDIELTAVMSKHADGIGIEKLKKKILKKYKTKFDDELNERQLHGFEKKFTKKLKKNQFKIEDDIVKPVS